MSSTIVEITNNGIHLGLLRNSLKITSQDNTLAVIPLDSIEALLVNSYQATVSQNIIVACADEGIPIIFCSPNHNPASMVWPVVSHHKQSGNLQLQLDASKPFIKNTWQKIIQKKIIGQAEVLKAINSSQIADGLFEMAKRVKSGDNGNIEAQASRKYWPALMGEDFLRNRDLPGINGLLNYGYAVLRSAVSRSVISVGLHPAIGLHHSNAKNPFCLVDDLMEVYRPLIDFTVAKLLRNNICEVNKESKLVLAGILEAQIIMGGERRKVSNAVLLTAQSLTRSFEEKELKLLFPESVIPIGCESCTYGK